MTKDSEDLGKTVENGKSMSPSTAATNEALTREQFDFHLEEYKSLRTEIDSFYAQMYKTEDYSIIGAAAVWSLIFATGLKDEHDPFVLVVPFLPICLFVAGLLRFRSYKQRVGRAATYIAFLEEMLAYEGGWEHFIWRSRIQDIGNHDKPDNWEWKRSKPFKDRFIERAEKWNQPRLRYSFFTRQTEKFWFSLISINAFLAFFWVWAYQYNYVFEIFF